MLHNPCVEKKEKDYIHMHIFSHCVQVIGCRIVAIGADEMFDTDHEGLSFAAMINEHLPPYVKVLSCSRVNKKFTARRSCNERTYEYYLPTSKHFAHGHIVLNTDVDAHTHACADAWMHMF